MQPAGGSGPRAKFKSARVFHPAFAHQGHMLCDDGAWHVSRRHEGGPHPQQPSVVRTVGGQAPSSFDAGYPSTMSPTKSYAGYHPPPHHSMRLAKKVVHQTSAVMPTQNLLMCKLGLLPREMRTEDFDKYTQLFFDGLTEEQVKIIDELFMDYVVEVLVGEM
jgi:hypothetical protein